MPDEDSSATGEGQTYAPAEIPWGPTIWNPVASEQRGPRSSGASPVRPGSTPRRGHVPAVVRLSRDHPKTLSSANNLVVDLAGVGDHDHARHLAEDTLARRRRVLGDSHPALSSANNLARVLRALGEIAHACRVAQDTLTRRRKFSVSITPAPCPRPTTSSSDLAGPGGSPPSPPPGRRHTARRRRVLGDDHPDTLSSANNLAHVLRTRASTRTPAASTKTH